MADISRADVASLIQDAYGTELLQLSSGQSIALQAFETRDMGTKTVNQPVLATMPHAKWVNESPTTDDGTKPTGKVTWGNKQLIAEELAVIVPIHENVVDDASEIAITQIVQAGARALAYALDGAVYFGINKPSTWTSVDLYNSAVANGNVFALGDAKSGADISGCILQAADKLSDRYEPTSLFARRGLQYKMANQRDANGQPIFQPAMASAPGSATTVHGLNGYWVTGVVDDGKGGDRQVWDQDVATAIVVDASRVIIGVRQDVEVKYLDQATVGGINLAEKDMVAFRFKARYAYALGDDVAFGSVLQKSSPAAVVVPAAAPKSSK